MTSPKKQRQPNSPGSVGQSSDEHIFSNPDDESKKHFKPTQPSRFARASLWTKNTLVGVSVQAVLFILWLSLLNILFMGIIIPTIGSWQNLINTAEHFVKFGAAPGANAPVDVHLFTRISLSIAVTIFCLLPKLLTFCIAMLIQQRTLEKTRYRLVPCHPAGNIMWDACLERVKTQWNQELYRAQEGVSRLIQYAGIYGFTCSAVLTCCALLIFLSSWDTKYCGTAIAVSTAVSVSFGVNLGRIVVRAANRDSSVRMFAWACRGQLLVIASAVLLVALLRQSNDQLAGTVQSYVIIGAVVALFGERALQSITDRAAKVLNLAPMRAQNSTELAQINGLGEEDINRLAEEGIDTIHALALTSTPRLHFHTPYTLQRICDWQDQALLITFAGTKAQLFREQLMVRGATDAQMLAEELLRLFGESALNGTADLDKAEKKSKELEAGCNPFVRTLASFEKNELADIAKMLGFGTVPQARVALATLVEDEVIRRLRVYQSSSVKRIEADEPIITAPPSQEATADKPRHDGP